MNPTVSSSELFPANYEVLRHDRVDGYSGVLIAIKRDHITIETKSKYSTESVFAKIHTSKQNKIIIGTLYRPPKSDIDYMNRMCTEIMVSQNKSTPIWIGGDLNLPDINWSTVSLNGNQNSSAINKRFFNMVENLI